METFVQLMVLKQRSLRRSGSRVRYLLEHFDRVDDAKPTGRQIELLGQPEPRVELWLDTPTDVVLFVQMKEPEPPGKVKISDAPEKEEKSRPGQ